MEGDFFGAGDHEALAFLQGGDEASSIQQAVMGAGVEPRVATAHDFDIQLVLRQIAFVDVGDFKFTPSRGLDVGGDVTHLLVVKIKTGHSVIAFGLFGLFFNGFYIIHELGHGTDAYLTKKANRKYLDFYEGEYLANQVAIAYWQEAGYEKELQKCYQYALKFTKQLPNPVPKGEDPLKFFNTNYDELSKDPFKYGYYQFKQFVEIYENRKTLHLDDLLK